MLRLLPTPTSRETVSKPFRLRHTEYEQTQHAFRTSGGISLITKVLSTAHHWAVIKATCGLIRNLALNPANIPFFKDTGNCGRFYI